MYTSMLIFFHVSFVTGFISSFLILATMKNRELKGLRMEFESQREVNGDCLKKKQGLKQRMLS